VADRIGGTYHSDHRHPDAHEQAGRRPLKKAIPHFGAVLPKDGAFILSTAGMDRNGPHAFKTTERITESGRIRS
jgi:hypothetical protein